MRFKASAILNNLKGTNLSCFAASSFIKISSRNATKRSVRSWVIDTKNDSVCKDLQSNNFFLSSLKVKSEGK